MANDYYYCVLLFVFTFKRLFLIMYLQLLFDEFS